MIYITYLITTIACCLISAYDRPRLRDMISNSALKPHMHHIQTAQPILESISMLLVFLSLWMFFTSLSIPNKKELILLLMFESFVYLLTLSFAIFYASKKIYYTFDLSSTEISKPKLKLKSLVDRIVIWMPPRISLVIISVISINALNALLSLF